MQPSETGMSTSTEIRVDSENIEPGRQFLELQIATKLHS